VLAAETEPTEVVEGVVRLGTSLVNWYLVAAPDGVTVVDAGAPRYFSQLDGGLAAVGRSRPDVRAVVLTHAHADHIGCAEQIRTELNVPVLVHEDDRDLATTMKQPGKNDASPLPYMRHAHAWKLIGHLATAGLPKKIGEVQTFRDGETLDVPGRPRVLHTPGHTNGHVCLWFEDAGALIVGDLLCTLNPLTGARGPQLMPRAFNRSTGTSVDSLAKIDGLEARVLLVGHGEPWTEGPAEAVRRARAAGPT
jgi:glyoxylase-like metal-dependent hydrolase (beta-lactamase superfamily II)